MKKLSLMVMVVFISGCARSVYIPNDPRFAPVIPSVPMPEPSTSGSLYQEGFSSHLWEDKRSRRVGDILTVVLKESTSASKSSATTVDKSSGFELAAPTILGGTSDGGGQFGAADIAKLQNSYESEQEFEGQTAADQRNSLTGNITVTVARVLPNGIMLIQGEKWLTLGQGEEFIRITGLVRPEDVRPDNTVLSEKVADARIAYSSSGDLANAGKMGWLHRFFNSPFWPL